MMCNAKYYQYKCYEVIRINWFLMKKNQEFKGLAISLYVHNV